MLRDAPHWQPTPVALRMNAVSNKCLSCGAKTGEICRVNCCYRLKREKTARYHA